MKRRLPLGIQTFREIRERNCYYVDKTGYLDRLLDEGKQLVPVAAAAVRQEPVPGHREGVLRGQRGAVSGAAHPRAPGLLAAPPVVRLSFAGGNFAAPGYLPKNVIA